MDTKGGRYAMKINGQRFSGRGKATIKAARAVPKAEANRDGTGYATVEAKLASLELSFDRGSADDKLRWTEVNILKPIDVTFTEDDVGITHYFTNARFSGEPSLDTDSGEVSGMTVMSDQYSAR